MASFHTLSAIILLCLASASNACLPADRAALLAFKAALHEPYLGIFNSWKGNECFRGWYGVSCDPKSHRVADINLRGESEDPIFEKANSTGYMTGFISPAICKLTRLSSLTIADWKAISGPIPLHLFPPIPPDPRLVREQAHRPDSTNTH